MMRHHARRRPDGSERSLCVLIDRQETALRTPSFSSVRGTGASSQSKSYSSRNMEPLARGGTTPSLGTTGTLVLWLLYMCRDAVVALDHRQALKTGTTIAGVVCRDAVVLAADTRSTMGAIVADKNCEKIHKLTPYIFCCGAGTAAHAERVTSAARVWLRLEQLKSVMSVAEFEERSLPSRVVAAATGLSRVLSRRELSAAFVLGGWDPTGVSLYQIEPDGTSQKVQFTALGSGSLAAMAMLEARYRPDLSIAEGIALLQDAITSGILNDLGSGSNVDLCVIRREDVDYRRSVVAGHGGRDMQQQEEGGRGIRTSREILMGLGVGVAKKGTVVAEPVRHRGLTLTRRRGTSQKSSSLSVERGGGGIEKDVASSGSSSPSSSPPPLSSLELRTVELEGPDDEIEML